MKKLQLVIILIFIVLISEAIKPQWLQTNFSARYSPDKIVSFNNNLYVSAFAHQIVDTGGVFKSTDLGTTWARLDNEIFDSYCKTISAFSYNGTDYIYVTTDSGLYCSTNNGENWIEKNSIAGGETIGSIKQANGILYTAKNQHTYRSSDFGDNWQEIFFNSTNRGIGGLIEKDNYLIASVLDGVADFEFKSLDNGLTWSSYGNGLYQSNIGTIVGNNIYMGSATVLYKSTNDGLTWTGVQGLPSGYYYKNLKAYGDYLFCAHMTGIYFQHKDSTNWINASLDIMPSFLSCGEIDENYIYAGKFDSLIYRRSLSEVFTDVNDQPSEPNKFILEQNYPNPFNPSTTIHYTIPLDARSETKEVSLKVYDVLGNEVATLVDEEKPAGTYEVEFQSTVGSRQLASGIYFYQLKAGEYLETRKMLLLK